MKKLDRLIAKHLTKNRTLSFHDVSDILEDYEDVELAVDLADINAFSDFTIQEITEGVELFRQNRPDRAFA